MPFFAGGKNYTYNVHFADYRENLLFDLCGLGNHVHIHKLICMFRRSWPYSLRVIIIN